jgi:hypothetical protein
LPNPESNCFVECEGGIPIVIGFDNYVLGATLVQTSYTLRQDGATKPMTAHIGAYAQRFNLAAWPALNAAC